MNEKALAQMSTIYPYNVKIWVVPCRQKGLHEMRSIRISHLEHCQFSKDCSRCSVQQNGQQARKLHDRKEKLKSTELAYVYIMRLIFALQKMFQFTCSFMLYNALFWNLIAIIYVSDLSFLFHLYKQIIFSKLELHYQDIISTSPTVSK